MRIAWHLRRLRSMGPAEWVHRANTWSKARADRRRTSGAPVAGSCDSALVEHHRLYLTGEAPFYFSPSEGQARAQQVRDRFPLGAAASDEKAGAAYDGRLTLMGEPYRCGEPRIEWHRDPRTAHDWPRVFWSSVDIRASSAGVSPIWSWRVGQQHFVTTQAKAYLLTGDERYARSAVGHILHWIESNPPGFGVHWASPLAMGIRLINWCWTLFAVRNSDVLTQPAFATIMESVHDQAEHILRYRSRYSSANNHLIGEAAGLALVGMCFPFLRRAADWKRTGLQILEKELEKQIHPDGGSAEQANHYLLEVLEYNLFAWRLAGLCGEPVPSVWPERLSASADFLVAMLDGEGKVLAIGDSDDGRALQLDDDPKASQARSLLVSAALLLSRPDLKSVAGDWDETNHWLFGEEGRQAYQALPVSKPPPPTSRLFPQSGYAVCAAGGARVTMDLGPLGYLSTAAHGHADALSLQITLDGQPVLVDPGTYAYGEGGDWRRYFRSTLAHNTIAIDGLDQSEIWGTFLWGRKARARLLAWQSDEQADYLCAEQDGYARRGVLHRRQLFFLKPDLLIIRDDVRGSGRHRLEQTWHFAPNTRYTSDGDGRWRLTQTGRSWWIQTLGSVGMAIRWAEGESDPPQGWVSPRYGEKVAAPVLVLVGECTLPVRLTTVFDLNESQPVERGRLTTALAALETMEARVSR